MAHHQLFRLLCHQTVVLQLSRSTCKFIIEAYNAIANLMDEKLLTSTQDEKEGTSLQMAPQPSQSDGEEFIVVTLSIYCLSLVLGFIVGAKFAILLHSNDKNLIHKVFCECLPMCVCMMELMEAPHMASSLEAPHTWLDVARGYNTKSQLYGASPSKIMMLS